jgi:alkanesulfonate monooxygenase SsuD/methylene tetrahydromethanopterin reductase-like flavin-dependent oxidoreductase (luciferase family)
LPTARTPTTLEVDIDVENGSVAGGKANMKLGLFMMPCHPPERSIRAGATWDLEVISRADQLGYSEAWVGEHFTARWEPCPAPDLLLAQASLQTDQIRLGTGAHVLPYHHPAELAHRVAYLDHLLQGRLLFGVGAGGVPSDFRLFDVDGKGGENRRMMWEALDIILGLWAAPDPFGATGEYWSVSRPEISGNNGFHLRPLQDPHPPIGITSLSPKSESLRVCGQRGYIPLSLNLGLDYLRGHWETVEAGAAEVGRIAERDLWRVVRDVFVADTDDEAYGHTIHGAMGRMLNEFLLPQLRGAGHLGLVKHDPRVEDDEVDAEYFIRTNCLVGSVDTVVEKLRGMVGVVGPFGTLVQLGYDYSENPGPWFESMELLAGEVLPRLGVAA